MVGFSKSSIEFLILVFFFFFSISRSHGNTDSSDVICIESERDALLRFKQQLEDPSNRLSSWIPQLDCCKWVGITCDNLTAHVKKFNLANTRYVNWQTSVEREFFENSKLKGKISDSILNLKYLSHLDLSYNDFGGIQIPEFIGSLVSLNYLNLSGCGFGGLIPHQLENLSNLHQLDLRGNSPFDEVKLYSENLRWLHGFRSLLHLDLSYANLSKASGWLQDINKLPSLVELHLSSCELRHITDLSYVNFTSLSVLDISSNHNFNSLIPKWISNLHNLISLDLSRNHFIGPLPESFSNLTSLRNLNTARNYLNSSLPKWLSNLRNISSLDLHDNGFEGPIPCVFQNMSALTYLDLSESDLNSTIPNCLYTLHNLRVLDLHSLDLEGEISNDISNLTNLVSLDLSYNKLQGSLPRSIGTLCNLRGISLSGNKLSGKLSEILESFSSCLMDSLTSLNLRGNNISGHLTDGITKLRNLISLDLTDNMISGPIIESIGNMFSLQYLDLARNEINGILPKSLGSLSNLQRLAISYNRIEGIVSEVHFANLTNLTDLRMSENNLTLSFQDEWIPLFHLSQIDLRSCNLGPSFPKWLKSQKDFSSIDVSNAGISDIVPDWFWSLSTTYLYMNLSHNQISGGIPDFLLNGQFTMIYLGSNKFHGLLPRISSSVTELDLSNNFLSGNMSHFLCHSRSQNNRLRILHLEDNLLSGYIPDCWANWMSSRVIKLGGNNLSGKLPNSMGSLRNLESLHLRNNSLVGRIPESLKYCSELKTLDLGLNTFNGSIPAWMGTSFTSLMVLGLRSNRLSGLIPNELCQLSSLQIMDIGENNLIGSIPHCFGKFTAMATKRNSSEHIFYSFYYGEFLESAFVMTKGREFQYDNILTLMTSMDLSDNNLSGEVPQEIINLLGLKSLNLSGNHLSGRIPAAIGSMTELESLDFSRNQLSGQIPQSISELTFLNYLNFSYNNLSGAIPISTQLQHLDASSFIGNELCGPPLIKSCRMEKRASETGNEEETEEDGDHLMDEWFYLSVGVGFFIGFSGFWIPLFASRTWRLVYSKYLDSMWKKFSRCFAC